MALIVDLYASFAKKENSTATPPSVPLSLNCVLKEDCSIHYPVLGIENGSTWNPATYNYAFIGDFHRFYFISDWSYKNGLWWAQLKVDPLGTWKTYIYNSTEYVLRASSVYDNTIADMMFPAKSTSTGWQSFWPNQSHTPWQRSFSSGFYVVGIINSDSSSIGAVSYYAFTPAQFSALKSYLLSDVTWTDILSTNPDLGESLYKSLFNPFQYISSVNWFPIAFNPNWGTALISIKFGWWQLDGISCYRLTQYIHSFAEFMYVGEHPQASVRGKYLNGSPYSTYRLIAPPFGEFTLDGAIILNGSYSQSGNTKVTPLDVAIQIDFISGNGDLYITQNIDGNHLILLHSQTVVAVPIQIAQITTDLTGQIQNVVENGISAIGNMLTGNVGGFVGSYASGILNGFEMHIPHMQQFGNNGSIAFYQMPFVIDCIYNIMADDALTDKGRPLCREVQLSTLAPGYVMTAGSHIAIAGSDEEMRAVNDYLDGGVFLE